MSRETSGEDGANELLELLGALLNDTLTPAGQARLDHLLREEAWARVLYRRYINLHAALRFYHTAAPATGLTPAKVPREEPEQAPQPRRARHSRARRLLALAASVLILAGLSWIWGSTQWKSAPLPSEGAVLGILSAVHGPVRLLGAGGERRAEVGMALHARDTLAVSADASAVVALDWAVRAELGSETTLTFSSAEERSLHLKSGFLAVEAGRQPPGRPLRLFTPDARAEVLGTKFTLAAAPRQTRLRVAEGTVKLWSEPAGAGVVVPAGFGSGVAGGAAMPLRPSQSGEVLLIESLEKSYAPGQWAQFNRVMASRLLSAHVRRIALKVAIKDHRQVQASDLEGRPLVIVSVAAEDVGFEESLRRIGLAEATVPVICLEPIAFPVLGMTGPKRRLDFDWATPLERVRFALPGHPLSNGQTGLMRLPISFAWGRPSDDALRIASPADHPERAVLFAYETGKKMVGRAAPARRVGLLLNPMIVNRPDPTSWSLFEAAVNWCVEPAARRQASKGN